jgi:broad specificity phosphatase PhoE
VTLQRLVLWRHGETDYNAAQRMQGHLDSQLTSTGLSQARRAAPWLAELEPEILVICRAPGIPQQYSQPRPGYRFGSTSG